MDIEENIPVEVSYYFDQYLMHLIQEVTKRPSAEILAFFYELGGQIADLGAKDKIKRKRSGRRMYKKIVDYFPNTSVPFHMLVKGHKTRSGTWDPTTRNYTDVKEKYSCSAEVGFPEGRTFIKPEILKDISTALMERALLDAPLDGIVVPEFTKPVIRSPKMFVDLMNTFAGRPPVEKKRKSRKKKDGTAEAIPKA